MSLAVLEASEGLAEALLPQGTKENAGVSITASQHHNSSFHSSIACLRWNLAL